MDKLYAKFLPFFGEAKGLINEMKEYGIIGNGSDICSVQERFVDAALNLAASQGITCEPSGAAGLALLLQIKNKIDRKKKILVINTGCTNLTPESPF